jgi:4-hydroxy-3-methylbut-2-en-1-yl diphosphate reductase
MGLADQSPKKVLRILLAQPRGFCAGVERAIEIVERALAIHGAPVYVRHEIVHNKRVVENLKAKGARFVEEVDEIPEGAVTVFSAHGVSEAVERHAQARALYTIDATCPLVSKVHVEGRRYAERGYEVVLIGHAGHPEVVGTLGRIPGPVHLVGSLSDAERLQPRDPRKVAYVTQTTLSLDDTRDIIARLKERFPAIIGPDTRDICYATQNRQIAVRSLARSVDAILVVGARNSSNSNRLREIGQSSGVPSYLIEDAEELDPAWLQGASTVGISAGASAPEELVDELLDRLSSLFATQVETLFGTEERVQFRLPDEVARGVSETTFQEVSP